MLDFCTCQDWIDLKRRHATVFQWHASYGWVITWKELTDEKSHTQIHNYGISINYCPICGRKLEAEE